MLRAPERGFSLLEAVIATSIVGLAAVGALEALGAELRTAERARHSVEAAALADHVLVRLRLLDTDKLEPLADSLRRGQLPSPFEDYRWEATLRSAPGKTAVYDLAVTIYWARGSFAEATRVYRPVAASTLP